MIKEIKTETVLPDYLNQPLQIWPTIWAGGSQSWNPNRIFIQNDKGILAYIEHHGSGSGNHKYPTSEDYETAHLFAAAPVLFNCISPSVLDIVINHHKELTESNLQAIKYLAEIQRKALRIATSYNKLI